MPSQYYYVGNYEVDKDRIEGGLRVVHYHGEQLTAFGDEAEDFKLRLHLQRKEDIMEGEMRRECEDGVGGFLPLRLTRQADLP